MAAKVDIKILAHPFWMLYNAMMDSMADAPKDLDKLPPRVKKYYASITEAIEIYDIGDPTFKEQWERLNERGD